MKAHAAIAPKRTGEIRHRSTVYMPATVVTHTNTRMRATAFRLRKYPREVWKRRYSVRSTGWCCAELDMAHLLRMPLAAHEVRAEKERIELRALETGDRVVGAGSDWTLAIERRVHDTGDAGCTMERLYHSPNGRWVPAFERLESRSAVDVKGAGNRCSQTRFNDG